MDIATLNGFMAILYDTMEKMNKDERKFLLKSVRQARAILDLKYPLGKQSEQSNLILPTGGESAKILGTNP